MIDRTLMLYGKFCPSCRSQINCAYAPTDVEQSTCIESPGFKSDCCGSNLTNGCMSNAE